MFYRFLTIILIILFIPGCTKNNEVCYIKRVNGHLVEIYEESE